VDDEMKWWSQQLHSMAYCYAQGLMMIIDCLIIVVDDDYYLLILDGFNYCW